MFFQSSCNACESTTRADTRYKYIDIPLPLEMLGKNDICIRFSAANKKAGSVEEFDAETIGTGEIAFSYIGIRYNK